MVQILDYCTCKGVQESSPYDPIDRTDTFNQGETVFSWIKFGKTYPSDAGIVRWKWYKDGVLYYDGSTQELPDPTLYGYEYWNWYVNSAQYPSLPAGSYYVNIYLNDNFLRRSLFTITDKPGIRCNLTARYSVPSGTHRFIIWTLYGTDVDGTYEGFASEGPYQWAGSATVDVPSPGQDIASSITLPGGSITLPPGTYDAITIIIDGDDTSVVYDWKIDNDVLIVQ